MKNKKIIILAVIFTIIAIGFTISVKFIDVQNVGLEGTEIGFATFNKKYADQLPFNEKMYDISKYLGYAAFIFVAIYGCIGIKQLIQRKSLLKVDKEIIALGVFYIVVLALYVLFDKVALNYRPVMLEGVLEASYPSSHTLMAVCIAGSSIILNKKLFKNKIALCGSIIAGLMMLGIVFTRILSGVHWMTDIMGGLLISLSLLSIYKAYVNNIN